MISCMTVGGGFEACGVLAAIKQNTDVARKFFTINGWGRLASGKYSSSLPSLMLTTDHAVNSLRDAVQ